VKAEPWWRVDLGTLIPMAVVWIPSGVDPAVDGWDGVNRVVILGTS